MSAEPSGTSIRRIVDLSHGIDDEMTVYPGDPRPSLTPAATIQADGFNVLHVAMGSQSGTHLDAPYHFEQDGARVDELDLSLFVAPAIVVDVRGMAPRSPIGWQHLAGHASQLQPGRILVLHTGWSVHWRSALYFEHPFLEAEAAERVIAAGVRVIALDVLNIDETDLQASQPNFDAHHVVLGAGGVIVENLTNLDAVDWPDPWLSVLPIRLTAADGAPVRAVALDLVSP